MVTAEGQTLSAEVTVHLSGPTDEAPSITLERSESFPDVDLSISDPGRGEQGAAWRSTLTVSHPARVVLPPGYVWEGAVVVEVGNDRRMEVPFTVRIGSTGPVDRKAREFMAGRLGVPVDEIMVTEVEPVTFNDGAKGCDRGEHAVVTAEVAGFIITLAHGSAVHIVHTDEHGLHFVVRENCIEGFWRPR